MEKSDSVVEGLQTRERVMVGSSLKILFEGLGFLPCRDAAEALTEESKTPASSLWNKFSDICS
jgi:hypothetical protein